MRSAQAAQITQSGLSLEGSGFLTRVTGNFDRLEFTEKIFSSLPNSRTVMGKWPSLQTDWVLRGRRFPQEGKKSPSVLFPSPQFLPALQRKTRSQLIAQLFGYVNPSDFSVGLHAAGDVDGVSPEVVNEFLFSNHPGDHGSGVNSNPYG